MTGRSRKRLGAPAFIDALSARAFPSVARQYSHLPEIVHTMPESAARFKTISKNDRDIRTDHCRIDVLVTQILGRLGDRSKKRAYVFTHRPLRSDHLVAHLLLFIFYFFIPP